MKITRKSMFTGKVQTMDIDVTQEQLDAFFKGGALIQNAMPNVPPELREFIMTGVTPEEWDVVFGGECADPLDELDVVPPF